MIANIGGVFKQWNGSAWVNLGGGGIPTAPHSAVTLSNGNNENINASGVGCLYVTGATGAFALGGFSGGTDGQYLVVINATSQTMTANNGDTGSTSGNRINTMTGGNVAIDGGNGNGMVFIYESVTSAWRLLASWPRSVVTTQTDVTSSRAIGSVYQNTGVKPLFVAVSVYLLTSSTAQAITDSSSSPSTIVGNFGDSGSSNNAQLIMIVLPGNYYKVIQYTGTVSLLNWIEWN
jgi:hypothetical protein